MPKSLIIIFGESNKRVVINTARVTMAMLDGEDITVHFAGSTFQAVITAPDNPVEVLEAIAIHIDS